VTAATLDDALGGVASGALAHGAPSRYACLGR